MMSKRAVMLVDCRSREERHASMIPGAVGPEALEEGIDKEPHTNTVVIYCTVGFRSSLAAQQLAANDPEVDVWSMAGILAWVHEGGESGLPAQSLSELPS